MAGLSDAQHTFIDDNPYVGTLTTLGADGSPDSTVVWIDTEGDVLQFNTARGRAKERHLLRDPRLAVTIVDPQIHFAGSLSRGRGSSSTTARMPISTGSRKSA